MGRLVQQKDGSFKWEHPSGSYEAIPLEVNAYSLGGRFETSPRQVFSVEDEVRKLHAEGGL
jgi:hypothetical protein